MSQVKIQGNASGTGIFTIASPATNTDRTLTLPDATGTVQVSGNAISGTTGTFTGLVDISAASAGQVKFPANQNPSSDANTLDDYEEGTWTPSYSSSGATFTYQSQSGTYVKIGRMVMVNWDMATATVSVSNGAAQVTIAGLPFTASVSCNGIINQSNNWASNNPNCCIASSGSTTLQIGPNNFIQNAASIASYLNTSAGTRNETHGTLVYYTNA